MEGEELRIVAIGPCSGSAAELGSEMLQAAQMAVEEWNLRAGGMTVAFAQADDRGKVEEGVRLAETLAVQPGVLGVVGHYNSDVTLAAAPIYEAKGLPLVAPIVSNPRLTEQGMKHIFRFTNRDDRTAMAIASYLYEQKGKRRVAAVETTTTYGSSMTTEFVNAFEHFGGEVVFQASVDEGAQDMDSLVRGLPPHFDSLFYGGTFEGAPLLKSLRAAGFRQLFAAGDGCWDYLNFLDPAGLSAEKGEGVLVLSATPELGKVEGSVGFAERYEDRFGPINNYALNSYDSTRLLLSAIYQASERVSRPPTRSELTDQLKVTRLQGIAYPNQCAWDPKGDNIASVTALHEALAGRFHQIAQFPIS